MTYNCYDIESGRVVSVFANVAGARLTGAVLTNGSASVTVDSTAELWPGMIVVAKGIPANTVVLSIDSATAFTMTANATAALEGGIIVARGYVSETVVRELHIEHYRDIFSGAVGFALAASGNAANGLPVTTVANGQSSGSTYYIVCPVAGTVPSGGAGLSGFITGQVRSSQSDDISHTPPRAQIQKVSTVFFICNDGAILPATVLPNLHFTQDLNDE